VAHNAAFPAGVDRVAAVLTDGTRRSGVEDVEVAQAVALQLQARPCTP